MSPTAQDIARVRGRAVGELTRRDVALALLEVGPDKALAALPRMRRELTRAGNAFSAEFWESCERLLGLLAAGEATVGDVDAWLESTGTHPTRMVGLLVWDDEGERRPVADEVHGELVAYLEEQFAAGRVDPDRLALGDTEEHETYFALQEQWLFTADESGRAPAWRVLDEEDEELEAAWEEADRVALAELDRVLADVGDRPCPCEELSAAVGELRGDVGGEGGFDELLAIAAWADPAASPADEAGWWLAHAQGTFEPAGEPPEAVDPAVLSAWGALQHADWLAAVAALARGGPGTSADPRELAGAVSRSPDVETVDLDPDDEQVLAAGFGTVVQLWRRLGAVDADDRLTPPRLVGSAGGAAAGLGQAARPVALLLTGPRPTRSARRLRGAPPAVVDCGPCHPPHRTGPSTPCCSTWAAWCWAGTPSGCTSSCSAIAPPPRP
jgi:CBS domain-containing protein